MAMVPIYFTDTDEVEEDREDPTSKELQQCYLTAKAANEPFCCEGARPALCPNWEQQRSDLLEL